MADAGAGVSVVVQEHCSSQFLHQIGFFIGAARRGDHTHGLLPVFGNYALHAVRGEFHRLGPRDFFPRVVDAVADHRRQDAVLVGGIAIGKAALDAGMATVGLAVLVRDHPHQLVAAQFSFKLATHTAIGAGGDDRAFRCADFDDRLFLQGRCRAGLYAGTAGHAIRGQRIIGFCTERHTAVKASTFDGQRKGALHLFTSPHTARADDAFRRVIGEVGVALVLGFPLRIGLARVVLGAEVGVDRLIAHIAQADGTSHVLQLAIAIGRAGQAVQRVVRDIQLHYAATQLFQIAGLGFHPDAGGNGRGARGGRAIAAFDFHKAQAAGAKGLKVVGRAQLWHCDANLGGGSHYAGVFGHGHIEPVDVQGHRSGRTHIGRAKIAVRGNNEVFHSAASIWAI